MPSKAIDAFVAYQFIKILSTPWKKTKAFELGIIDERGKVLKKRRTLKTRDEKNAYTIFHTLVWNIKRLLEKTPVGKSKIGSFVSSLYFLKEHCINSMQVQDFDFLIEEFEKYLREKREQFVLTENIEFDEAIQTIFEETEFKDSTTINPGKYTLIHDIDTPAGLARTGTVIHITSKLKAFDMIAGVNVFKIPHPIEKNEHMVISLADIEEVE